MGTILLFYKYVTLENPERVRKQQRQLCEQLGLTGRILLATEGINGTLGGSDEACKKYIDAMRQDERFADIDFKTSPGSADHFPKLKVKVRPEIVRLGLDPHKVTAAQGGAHLTPEQAHALLEDKPADLVVIDCRNTYESAIGTFRGAIRPDTQTFRDFPQYVKDHADELADKQVLMFCTGGIRCERASAVVKQETNAKQVYQIEGGIHRYVEQYPDGHFRGKNYVFDARIATRVNNDVIGSCAFCHTPSDDMTNCVNIQCNKQFIACPSCHEKFACTCCEHCADLVKTQQVPIRQKPAKVMHGS